LMPCAPPSEAGLPYGLGRVSRTVLSSSPGALCVKLPQKTLGKPAGLVHLLGCSGSLPAFTRLLAVKAEPDRPRLH